MNNWRFAFSRRYFGYLAFAIIFAIACVLLSMWQVARREEALDAIAKVTNNYESAPLPLDEVLADSKSFAGSQEWTPVTMTGTYLEREQLLVRNRPYGGSPGFEVLTPLQLTDGSIFIVDRGWLPNGSKQDLPDTIPAAPTGEVTVEARLKPGEPTLPGRSAPAGQVATINLPQIAEALSDTGETVYSGAYGLMASESRAAADPRPAAAVKPEADEGPHLSYAIQWIVFAFFGFFGLGYAIRQEYRILNADDPEERERAAVRERKARAKAPSDSDIEDAILDARR